MNPPTLGNGKICYLEIPSRDIEESAAFYHSVFQWQIRTRGNGTVAFDDGVGQVSGTWKPDRKPFNEIGILIYIMVDDMEQTIRKLTSQGGELVQPVGADFPEITARFLDPSGNLLGLFQEMG
jgi:predicted enzyme related to lactoylglutathione lyase